MKILFALLSISLAFGDDRGVRFQSLKCEADNETVVVKYCDVKVLSKNFVGLNIGLKLLKTLRKPIIVQLIVNYRFGNVYRQVMDVKDLEWCGIMNGRQSNPVMKHFINMTKDSAPQLFHQCPYSGDIDVQNMTQDVSKVSDIYPTGFYRVEVKISSKQKEILKVLTESEVKSKLKERSGK